MLAINSRYSASLPAYYGVIEPVICERLMALDARVPQRGVDYGNPNYGSDTFDFIFRQEQIHPPTQACVTVQGNNGPETSCQ